MLRVFTGLDLLQKSWLGFMIDFENFKQSRFVMGILDQVMIQAVPPILMWIMVAVCWGGGEKGLVKVFFGIGLLVCAFIGIGSVYEGVSQTIVISELLNHKEFIQFIQLVIFVPLFIAIYRVTKRVVNK